MHEIVRAWVDGWVVSRGAAPPQPRPWGVTIDVGDVQHVSRHVLGAIGEGVDEAVVRKVAGEVTGAGVWLKAFRDPGDVSAWLGPGWWVDPEPGYLMTVPLAPPSGAAVPDGAGTVPDGYAVRDWTRGGVTKVLVTAPDGSLAARGQIVPTGAQAVVDRIETAPAHRRRGLGGLVVRRLLATAVATGARRGVLAATPDGRALYEALGWRVEAVLTSAKFVGVDGGE